LWLVGELELAHEHIDAGGTFGGLDTPKFLATNPHGRMPRDSERRCDRVGIQVERWYRTPQQRTAFAEHVMIPFDELHGRLDF
jgi:hypothetical protein